MKKEFICISCPMGCPLTVWEENGEVLVSGNTCPRGKAYGIQEFTCPQRVVTSSVPVRGGEQSMCSVKTDKPVAKTEIAKVLAAIYGASVKAPVKVGDIVIPNVDGNGANVVATRRVLDRKK